MVPSPNSTAWPEEEICELIKLSTDCTSLEIAKKLNRSQAGVFSKARKLGIRLTSKKTSSHNGKKAEEDAQCILPGLKLVNSNNRRLPFDAIWKGKKINVKSSKLLYDKRENRSRWNFKINGTWENCNYFLLLGYGNDYKLPIKAFLIPISLCRIDTIKISENYKGKYLKFEIGS